MGCAALMAAHSPSSIRVDGSARLAATCVRSPTRTLSHLTELGLWWPDGLDHLRRRRSLVHDDMYALERRGSKFVLAFAVGCALSSTYGFLSAHGPSGGRGPVDDHRSSALLGRDP